MQAGEPGDRIQDILDVLRESASQEVERLGPDDKPYIGEAVNHRIIWWKTHAVNSIRFGRMALELEMFGRLAKEAYRRMPFERAEVVAQEVGEICDAYMRSVDAKSSESRRDAHNSQATYLDRINRNKVEHVYTSRDAASQGILAGVLGRRREADLDHEF